MWDKLHFQISIINMGQTPQFNDSNKYFVWGVVNQRLQIWIPTQVTFSHFRIGGEKQIIIDWILLDVVSIFLPIKHYISLE